jgi:hypothetical protein
MTAAKHHITIDQGATFRLQLTYKIDGTAVDLSNYTARMQIRQEYDSESPSVSLTTAAGGGITLGGAAGTIDIEITNTQTAALPAGQLVYDLELVAPNGDVTRLIGGNANVRPEATR